MIFSGMTLRPSLLAVCLLAGSLALAAACGEQSRDATLLQAAQAQSSSSQQGPVGRGVAPTGAASRDSIVQPAAPLVPTPEVLRGLYVNRWAALGQRVRELIAVARRTEINALVIDVKDDRGFVLYRSGVPLAREIGADANSSEVLAMPVARVRALLDTMRAHGIYPIARIVVAKDPLLASARPEWTIVRKRDGTPWTDRQGTRWLDPHNPEVWQYAADLAAEAVHLGFSEVQFDYVRFPDEGNLMAEAAFPLAAGRLRADVIREQLGMMRASLAKTGVPFTIDAFGLTTSDTTDMGIGQRWERFVDQADVVLPMTYPSHYARGSYGIAAPNSQPYAIIDKALKAAKRRTQGIDGAAKIIPWYQDFTLGAPRYGPAEVRAQIQAGYDNGIMSWILWNPRSVYNLEALQPAR
jgi:hypothetical protein